MGPHVDGRRPAEFGESLSKATVAISTSTRGNAGAAIAGDCRTT